MVEQIVMDRYPEYVSGTGRPLVSYIVLSETISVNFLICILFVYFLFALGFHFRDSR